MNNSFSYQMPTKIAFGKGSLKNIDQYIRGRRTLLLTSKGAVSRGLVALLNSYTTDIVSVISSVTSHPDIKAIKALYEEIQEIDFELILAVGGGSVLDSAKCLSIHNESWNFNFLEEVIRGKQTIKNYSSKPIISVPTTAGTASELTPWATVWDMESKAKYSLSLPCLFSEVAIYDATLTLSLPRDITIQTALDALSHSLESIWNKYANPITINYAVRASNLLKVFLPKLLNDLGNVEYREKVMEASMYSGMAFSNTKTAIAHALSYYITAHKGVPHGLACSFTLPMIISAAKKNPKIDKILQEIFGNDPYSSCKAFFSDIGVDTDYSSYHLNERDLEKLEASLDGCERAQNSLINFRELAWNL